ncbi:MAG: endolytic transglycosylase MltG [Candidatus Gracilibacteria bacterium]|nr:endolytic transglycosylase MltG [Candidatus Gracilibacteria bacterium]
MEEKKQNIFFRLIKLFIWIAIIGGVIIYNNYSNFKTEKLITKNKIIEIKSGETIKDFSEKLNINYYFIKKYLSDNNKSDFGLLVGRFELKKDSNIEEIIISMQTPIAEKEIELTILEGWNIFDIDDYLTKKGLINSGEYISYSQNSEKIKALSKFYKFLNPDFITLEGYLYPDSYKLKYPLAINKLIIKQLDNFENKVYNKILSDKSSEEINKIINLASIVEKEEKSNSEKSTVAGILKKRLENNWNIGADITVCYPHSLTANECKMVISKYIREESEYNTRTMTGLPKTPIGNPQFSSITAVVNPNITEYWFYLHNTNTGKIYYGKTNAEHEANKKYLY